MSARGEAGAAGPDVRSDCRVVFEAAASGGVQIEIESKVASMYGRQIRELVGEVLAALGIGHARVAVDDAGAVPFVIAARVETAVRRALPAAGRAYLPAVDPRTRTASARDRMRRSRLYLPGNEPRFMLNAGLHAPDGVILDLEDSVAPTEKDAARILVRNALRVVDFGAAERMVRINQGELGLTDLDAVIPHHVHVILIPKCEDAGTVRVVDAKIRDLGRASGAGGEVFLLPIIESALGAIRAYEIASAVGSVVALAVGLEDYTADIGAERTLHGKESEWARAQVVNAARAAGVQPIDSVFSDVADLEGLRRVASASRALGFEGMGCIHPRQIAEIHDAYAPDASAVERAKRVVLAFERAQAEGKAVVALGSKMIDPPVVKRALRTVQHAVMAGRLPASWREEVGE
jgi:citrate lyase subunit beta/citryl-CoA lyase